MDLWSLILTLVVGTLVVSLYLLKGYLQKVVNGGEVPGKAESLSPSEQLSAEQKVSEPKQKKKVLTERKSRDSKSTFNHPWHVTTLKGHTSHILDLDFSPNGKYLASCAEVVDRELETASSDSNSDASLAEPQPEEKEPTDETEIVQNDDPFDRTFTRLSRRQRKNRQDREKQREKQREVEVIKKVETKEKKKKRNVRKIRCGSYVFTEDQIYPFLRSYALSDHALLTLGFPLELEVGKAVIYKADIKRLEKNNFDVNANEFVPGKRSYNSKFDETPPSHTPSSEGSNDDDLCTAEVGAAGSVQKCIRCLNPFVYTEGSIEEECVYHPGKYKGYGLSWGGYKCCGGKAKSEGCLRAKVHVWSGLHLGFNGPLSGFLRTKKRKDDPLSVYAMDCEMVYTTEGREVARVTLVDVVGNVVYDEHVKPQNQVVDYVTRFSGITEKHVTSATKTLRDVQCDLQKYIFADTVLIGHALNNDLQVLRLIHPICVDTSVVFTHHKGLPRRYSLKDLARSVLSRCIQSSDSGHCSVEDAVTCLDLMMHRVLQDYSLDNNGSSGSH